MYDVLAQRSCGQWGRLRLLKESGTSSNRRKVRVTLCYVTCLGRLGVVVTCWTDAVHQSSMVSICCTIIVPQDSIHC